ncbi:MAG: hypothetical protein HY565_03620 [Candidatus Kerfeldbacteria bacterium]|nr:hypothetical protein [Candidatus Kerfeldbacteria bacterium]
MFDIFYFLIYKWFAYGASMSFFLSLFLVSGLATPAHADPLVVIPPSTGQVDRPSTWYGYMVFDQVNHKIALLHWQGSGTLDPTQSTVVVGTRFVGDSTIFHYAVPLPGFFTEVFDMGTIVLTTAQLNPSCSVTSFALQSRPPLVLTSNGVTGIVYQASLAKDDLLGSKGEDCARILDTKSR